MNKYVSFIIINFLILTGICLGLDKEVSLLTKEPIGELAVAGRLSIDLHSEFMVSRTYENDTVLNWYNCGYSGGGNFNTVGGNFGDFGLHVPHTERDKKYPHAVSVGDIRAVRFDGNDIMKGNFPAETNIIGKQNMAVEAWLRDENPLKGEIILAWQSKDGKQISAPLFYSSKMKASDKWRHMVVNCIQDRETWYVDGQKIADGKRITVIKEGHIMVLGGASETKPSFKGDLAAVRLHDTAMTEEEILHNFKGGVMLGTEMHSWWRLEPDKWWTQESEHFRHCVDTNEMAKWSEKQMSEFTNRVPGMFDLAELIYHTYSERLALRSSIVSTRPEFRGDGIKYKTPIQPAGGSFMGWDGDRGFGWACQGAGFINPHELVHGWQGQTGGAVQGNYWEAHANFPQTYNGIYQTAPPGCCSRVCMYFPAHGRCFYHARLMFEHLAQTPEYGPMFISKIWHDGATEKEKNPYPWISFTRLDPDPSTPFAYEYARMIQRNVTWDYVTFEDAQGGKGNTGRGNDYVISKENRYQADARNSKADITRYARIILKRIPYDKDWWRVPKEMAPQQLGWNICPLKILSADVEVILSGYMDTKHGSDWRASLVSVDADGKPTYGKIVGPGQPLTLKTDSSTKELYLTVCAVPTNLMAINMTGDFRSFEQEPFPYKVKLKGCEPLDVMVPEKPTVEGTPHHNGGGFVEKRAQVEATAYVGPNAMVIGNSKVLGNARIMDHAVVQDSTVQDNAIVSGYAHVNGGSVIQDYAKVRDYARTWRATVKDHAKILEHGEQRDKPCGGYAVIKGGAVSFGDVSGNSMIDGSYCKGNEITKGRWFTWSWGTGKNPGEDDVEFGGLYMQMLFDQPHEWMAQDDFGATWGYLVGNPEIRENPESVKMSETADVVEDSPRFVLPRDPGEKNPNSAFRWDNYGSLMRGYLHPPVTGDYTFWVYADDSAKVSLSPDSDPEKRNEICSSRVSGMHNYNVFPEQKSKPIHLEKGKTYYIESLFKAAGGGDYMGVAWEYTGQERIVIEGQYLSKTSDGPTGMMSVKSWHNINGGDIKNLTDNSRFCRGLRRTSSSMLVLNGENQFVELQNDVADMTDITIKIKVNWQGGKNERIFDFSNDKGDSVYLSPSTGGKCIFVISKDGKQQALQAPALKKGQWTEIAIVLSGDTGKLFIDGKPAASNDAMTLNPEDISATQCYLGRNNNGDCFKGEIDSFEIYSLPLDM